MSTPCKSLVDRWYSSKSKFIEKFGNETIYKSPAKISIALTEQQREKIFNQFIEQADQRGLLNCSKESVSLNDFLQHNKDGFFDNVVKSPCEQLKIVSGAKLLKSFKHFIDDKEQLKKLQNLASSFIQEDKIEGYLYLSCDPIDYLTISETNCGWRSCHSLDGDYRAGNLNYMCDDTTIVAYLCSGNKEKLRCMPEGMKWYSKKWRMLVHINDGHCIYYSRQYPYSSVDLLYQVYNAISGMYSGFSKFIEVGVTTVNDDVSILHNHIIFRDVIESTEDCLDYEDYKGYRDMMFSNYRLMASVNTSLSDKMRGARSRQRVKSYFHSIFDMKIGGAAPCPCCGEEYIHNSNELVCNKCSEENKLSEHPYPKCTSCERRLYPEDNIYTIDGSIFCASCAREIKEMKSKYKWYTIHYNKVTKSEV